MTCGCKYRICATTLESQRRNRKQFQGDTAHRKKKSRESPLSPAGGKHGCVKVSALPSGNPFQPEASATQPGTLPRGRVSIDSANRVDCLRPILQYGSLQCPRNPSGILKKSTVGSYWIFSASSARSKVENRLLQIYYSGMKEEESV
jgi:hypothetical protein